MYKTNFESNCIDYYPHFTKIDNNFHTSITPESHYDAYDEIIYDGGELTLPQGVTDVKDKED